MQVTLLHPDALADPSWNASTPVLDSLAFPTLHAKISSGAGAAAADSRLTATVWRLVEIALMNDDGVHRPAEGGRYELVFEPGGQLTVQGDCNGGRRIWSESAEYLGSLIN